VTLESLLAMRRAGADILITYAAMDVAKWLR
jgi:porphobilinogen synthase